MTREMIKVSCITKEIMDYFFTHGAKDINLKIEDKEDRIEINVHSDYTKFTDEEVERIRGYFNIDREIENEEYYWQVMGLSDEGEEMLAIGVMIDDAIIKWNKPSLDIFIIRKK